MHLISTLDVGGAERSLLRLVTSMDRSAFQNRVVSMTRPGTVGRSLEGAGVPVLSLNMAKGTPELRAIVRLWFMAALMKPDIIQCWMYHAHLLGLALMKPGRTLWNIRCSDMDLSRYGRVYRLTVKAGALLSRVPCVVVANSHAGRDVHERLGYRPKEWAVLPNGFDTGTFRPDPAARAQVREELGIPADAFVVGLVARLDPMKDHATFFRAADSFLASCPGAHFVLAGSGVDADNPLMKPLLPRNHGGRIHLLGERSDIARVNACLDAATSSSLSEGLPNAVGEAMATGVPCVVTDVGDSALLVGDTGIVVPKGDPEALSVGWKRLLDPDLRRTLGDRSRKRIMDQYSLRTMVDRYEDLYRRVMENPGG
jgi:glycosyltransferase involved in cell wall biosynthesis